MRRPLPVNRNCCVSWEWFSRVWKLSLKSLSVCPSAERTYMLRYSGFSRGDLLARSTVFLSSRSCSSTRTRPGPRPLAARRVTATISIPGSPMPWWISPLTPVISWLGSSWELLGRLATTTMTPGSKGSWTGGGARVSKTSSRRLSTVIWRMTLKNNRAPLLCYFKLCAAFHSHWWIRTGVTVPKRPIWVKFDDF